MWVRGGDMRSHREYSYDYALAKAREAHWKALVATALLKRKIERLSWSVSRRRSTGCQHSSSHHHLRRWSTGCLRRCTKTPAGGDPSGVPSVMSHHGTIRGDVSGLPAPPDWEDRSLSKTKLWLTEDSSSEQMEQALGGGEPAECDLGPPPTLEPELESFL